MQNLKLKVAISKFADAANTLLEAMLEDDQDIVNNPELIDVYPFTESFDEIVSKIDNWAEVFQDKLEQISKGKR